MRVTSKVGNLPFKFGYAKPLAPRIIRYVRDERTYTDRPTDGQTNGRTDGQKQLYLPLPYRQGIKNGCLLIFVTNSMIFFSFICNSKRLVAGLHQNPLGELQNVISMISFKGTSSPD